MTQIFYDDFSSPGSMNGKTPDVNLGSTGVWSNGDSKLSSNGSAMVCAAGTTPLDNGAASCGIGSPASAYSASGIKAGVLSVPITITDTSQTGAYFAVRLGVIRRYSDGNPFKSTVWLHANASHVWVIDLIDDVYGTLGTSNVTVVAGVSNVLSLTFSETAVSASFNGQTVSGSAAYPGYVATDITLPVVAKYASVESVDFSADVPITATAHLTAPSPTIAFSATVGGVATAFLTAPSPILSAWSGSEAITATAHLTAPSPKLYAIGRDSTGENAAHLTAPRPALTFYGGALAKLTAPKPTLTASTTVTTVASAALTAPSPVLVASATVGGAANAALKAPSPNLVGYGGAVCHITLTGRPTVQASATVGAVASAAITCPLFELTAHATLSDTATAHLIAPSPRMGATAQAWLAAPMGRLTAIGTATITATYEAYAVNLKHTTRPGDNIIPTDETTRYTNFPFTHVVRYQGNYYGANSTGLYLLEGTTDAGTPIPWAVETALTDFKTPNKKTLAAAYFSGRFGPASTIKLKVGEANPISHSFSTPRGQLAQNHRQVFGKGNKARYYAIGASGTGTVELDGIECDVLQLTRRI